MVQREMTSPYAGPSTPGSGDPSRLLGHLAASDDPVLAYKARLLLGLDTGSDEAIALRHKIAGSAMARALLSGREPDGTIRTRAYKKWQGPHWTLVSLALIDYPPGDPDLRPMVDQVCRWLLARQLPGRRTPSGQESTPRFCASQEGNAIWASIVLGLDDERTAELARRLVHWQWPDGGWNCDPSPAAGRSSFQETAIPLRGLLTFGHRYGDRPALEAAARAAELLLTRRLLWRLRDGELIRPDWGGRVDRIHFPIQFYDVLFSLQVMAEAGRIGDPRCADALRLLESKRLGDLGFPLEEPNATRADRQPGQLRRLGASGHSAEQPSREPGRLPCDRVRDTGNPHRSSRRTHRRSSASYLIERLHGERYPRRCGRKRPGTSLGARRGRPLTLRTGSRSGPARYGDSSDYLG